MCYVTLEEDSMRYTVKQLATLSGVSARTLRQYDEIGLLKPAYYGENQYRYYKEEQLLLLQQILFYRELGFSLNDIESIMNSDDFDKIEALNTHKIALNHGLEKTKNLLKTIDKTIAHLRGKTKMKAEELYYGFDSEQQKKHEKDLVSQGIVTQEFLDECNSKVKNWSDKEKNQFIQEIEQIMAKIITAIDNHLSPADNEVQELMRQHYYWLERSWTPTKESYLGLRELYQRPDFATFYTNRHPDLLEFIVKAMTIFSESL